ncbi:MAG: isoprenylcysteine carboxylmethyltransferase family protein [Acidobacteria bacterium]|nr:isoprenylcysteine carboxylmethyltransferase family protein [Acidobacteriota bacterium]
MPLFPKRYADTVQRLRVPSGLLLAGAFVWLADPVLPTLILGLPFAAAGLAIRAWAAGHLRKNQQLTVSGPYAMVRNPLYIGSLLTALGCTLAAARPELTLLAGVIFLFVYLPVMEQEEQHLAKLFPDYQEYASRVPQLLPRLPHAFPAQSFSWQVFKMNKEQKALYGFLAVYGFLILKAFRPLY